MSMANSDRVDLTIKYKQKAINLNQSQASSLYKIVNLTVPTHGSPLQNEQ